MQCQQWLQRSLSFDALSGERYFSEDYSGMICFLALKNKVEG